jgi:hypothetical protein
MPRPPATGSPTEHIEPELALGREQDLVVELDELVLHLKKVGW